MIGPIGGGRIPPQMLANRIASPKAMPSSNDSGPDNRTLSETFADEQKAIGKARAIVLREHGKTEEDFDVMTPEEKYALQPEIDDLADNHAKLRGADGKFHDVPDNPTEAFLQSIGWKSLFPTLPSKSIRCANE